MAVLATVLIALLWVASDASPATLAGARTYTYDGSSQLLAPTAALRTSTTLADAKILWTRGQCFEPLARGAATGFAANGGAKALDWSRATINDGGVAAVERHLARFESGPEEAAMLGRLRSIAGGEMEATGHDLRFYTHELRESVLYRKAGYPSGEPADGAYELWDQLHTQALTDYGLTRGGAPMDLFHPSVRP